VHTPRGARWKHGQWSLESPLDTAADIEDHIEWLLERLLPVRERVAEVLAWDERIKADFFCGVYLNSHNEEISLKPATLAAISSLHAELNFDIHGEDESSDASSGPTP
jgi:hypothetical protein